MKDQLEAVLVEALAGAHLPQGARLLLGCSGGADSVALLHAAASMQSEHGCALIVVHVHHGLRGGAADADAESVRLHAAALNLSFIREDVDVARRCETSGESLEMSARALRFDVFSRLMQAEQCSALLLGQHRDDRVETLLMRLMRGSGLDGLSALSRDGLGPGQIRILRPFIDCSRSDIKKYLHDHGIDWREDSSNQDADILRNRVRHELIPLLEDYHPALRSNLASTAELLELDAACLNQAAADAAKGCFSGEALIVTEWLALPDALRSRVLRQWLFRCGVGVVSRKNVNDITALCSACASGRRSYALSKGQYVCLEEGLLYIPTERSVPEACPLLSGALPGWQLTARIEACSPALRGGGLPGVYPASVVIDADHLDHSSLTFRSRRPGDRFAPYGFNGTKSIKQMFIDAHIPQSRRPFIPLLCDGEEIIWVPGFQVAATYAIKSATVSAVRITLI